MKICFFGTRMDLISGHSRPAFELASRLTDRGHEVRIVSTSLDPVRMARHETALARSPHLTRIPVNRPFADLRGMVQDIRRSRARLDNLLAGCDLLHGFSFNALSILSLIVPLRLPLVLSVNTDIRPPLHDYLKALGRAPYYLRQPQFVAGMFPPHFLLKFLLLRFDRVICWSRFLQDRLRSIGLPKDNSVRIPVGLDKTRFNLHERHKVQGSPVFLYAGLLSSLRGIPTLIRAFRDVVRVQPQARLIIADRGPHTPGDIPVHAGEKRRLKRLIAEYRLTDSLLLTHFEDNLSPWINACDAVVLPFSTTIGYSQPPLTILEAMAHAKPVISTRIGSIPEHVEDGISGILTEPGDAAGLARAMIRLDPMAQREMGENARRQIEANHDWDDIAAMTEKIYGDVIRGASTPSVQA
ncbi:MAG TPA: glycosyltransferase family 4 protein [Anaerolineales bacterium]|nr:glycosyltransferase family 4 protein [Anaerolineales bacterium]